MIIATLTGLASKRNAIVQMADGPEQITADAFQLEQGAIFPLLETEQPYLGHDSARNIGIVRYWVSNRGLEAEGTVLDTVGGRDALQRMQARASAALSIGYRFRKRDSEINSEGVRVIKRVKLVELTVLPLGFAADDAALIEHVIPAVPMEQAALLQQKDYGETAAKEIQQMNQAVALERMKKDQLEFDDWNRRMAVADLIEMHKGIARMYRSR
jgi:HK97 family phage prohead protease